MQRALEKGEEERQTCADICVVDEHKRDDGHVPLGFDQIVVFLQVIV